jgi:predicted XRE-type DNA-binding protein
VTEQRAKRTTISSSRGPQASGFSSAPARALCALWKSHWLCGPRNDGVGEKCTGFFSPLWVVPTADGMPKNPENHDKIRLQKKTDERKIEMSQDENMKISSGELLTDLDLPEADKLKIRSVLATEIARAVRRLKLSEDEAWRRVYIPLSSVSAMMRGDFSNLSLSEPRLANCLYCLGYDFEIKVHPASEPTIRLIKMPGRSRISDSSYTGVLPDNALHIDVECLSECVRLWNKNKYGALVVSDYDNPGLDNIDCLSAFENLSNISILFGNKKVALEPLLRHADTLKGICFGDDINGLTDIRPFTHLESLCQSWFPAMRFADSYPNLLGLSLTGTQSKSRNLEGLPQADNLESIDFRQTSIETLHGIERYPKLKKISIYSARKLRDIAQLAALENLEEVELEKCRHVVQGADWSKLHGMRKMRYMECAPLPDLQFIRSMPELRSLVIMDTNVLDGNMNPVLEHPRLEHFACTAYRHFTHKEAQLMKILRERKSGNFPSAQ